MEGSTVHTTEGSTVNTTQAAKLQTIFKPRGEVGCLTKDGYLLKETLGWEPTLYREVQVIK